VERPKFIEILMVESVMFGFTILKCSMFTKNKHEEEKRGGGIPLTNSTLPPFMPVPSQELDFLWQML
jgi:hypothetical protein